MEELVALVSKKTGLGRQQSKAAVKVVIDFIKAKLPAPIAAEVDAVLGGKGEPGVAADLIGDLLGSTGGKKRKK